MTTTVNMQLSGKETLAYKKTLIDNQVAKAIGVKVTAFRQLAKGFHIGDIFSLKTTKGEVMHFYFLGGFKNSQYLNLSGIENDLLEKIHLFEGALESLRVFEGYKGIKDYKSIPESIAVIERRIKQFKEGSHG